MNTYLSSRYSEVVHRLAVGLEIVDYCRAARIASHIAVRVDASAPPRPEFRRHNSCVHALIYSTNVRSPVELRLVDDARRFVPRRLRLPIATEEEVSQGDPPTNPVPAARRTWRPVLFPGAAYDVSSAATGLRGRAEVDSKPLRWARVVAKLQSTGEVVGRAHGDDRGEFLLIVFDPRNVDELPATLDVSIEVSGPNPLPDPNADPASKQDTLWDLPVEQAAPAGQPDAVSAGEVLPLPYRQPGPGRKVVRDVALDLGRIQSDPVPYEPA